MTVATRLLDGATSMRPLLRYCSDVFVFVFRISVPPPVYVFLLFLVVGGCVPAKNRLQLADK